MKASLATAREEVMYVMDNDKLFDLCMPDGDIINRKKGEWDPIGTYPGSFWVKVQDSVGEVVGVCRFTPYSDVAISGHFYLHPFYYGQGMSKKCIEAIHEWIRTDTQYHKIIVETPRPCKHPINAAFQCGYNLEGILSGACYWRGKVEDVVLLSKFIFKGEK